MNHHHSHSHNNRKLLLWAFYINFIFLIIEIIGGVYTGSLSLLSDAGHMFTDVGALGLAIIVSKIAERPPNEHQTYGYLKTEILGAFINGSTLIIICVFILWEAIQRLQNPQPIIAVPMLIIATLGLIANLISAKLLHKDASENLNMKAAFLHLIFDALASVAAIISSLIILFWKIYWVDTITSLIIVLLILIGTKKMILYSIKMLIDSVPDHLNYKKIKTELLNINHINSVHELHIWSIGQNEAALSAHLILRKDCTDTNHWDQCLRFTKEMLIEKFQIKHTTLQLEPYDFPNDKNCK